jgi:hypothetical protein
MTRLISAFDGTFSTDFLVRFTTATAASFTSGSGARMAVIFALRGAVPFRLFILTGWHILLERFKRTTFTVAHLSNYQLDRPGQITGCELVSEG